VLLTAKDIRYRIQAAEVAAVIACGEIAERADDFAGIKMQSVRNARAGGF